MAITYTEFPEKKRVEFTVSGQITKADYDSIAGPMEAFIDAHGTVQMIEVVDHFSGFDPGLLLPGLRFDIKALPHISHIAVVTDIGWLSPIAGRWARFCPPGCGCSRATGWMRRGPGSTAKTRRIEAAGGVVLPRTPRLRLGPCRVRAPPDRSKSPWPALVPRSSPAS